MNDLRKPIAPDSLNLISHKTKMNMNICMKFVVDMHQKLYNITDSKLKISEIGHLTNMDLKSSESNGIYQRIGTSLIPMLSVQIPTMPDDF
jgi:hypothetical protein